VLATILIWFYVTLLSLIYGLLLIKLLNKIFKFNGNLPSSSAILIIGLCFISVLILYLSFFIKIGFFANIIILAIGVIFLIIEFRNVTNLLSEYFIKIKETNKYILLLFLITFFIILIKTSSSPILYDTGLYHAQAIRWIEEYQVIPGLGNLHGRFAFNSSWFLPSALFSFAFFNLQSFHVLNGLFLMFGILFSLGGIHKIINRDFRLSNIIKTCVFGLLIILYSGAVSSPSPDLPVAFLIWFLFILFLEKIEDVNYYSFDISSILIVMIAVFILTIKISASPIIILPIFIISKELLKGEKIRVMILVVLVLLIFIPWILRNIILSGYLVYPFPNIDIFNFDWKIPIQKVISEKNWVESWSRIPGQDADEVLKMSFFEWEPIWFKNQSILDKIILYIIEFTSALYILYIAANIKNLKNWFDAYKKYLIPYFTACIGFLFWFSTAPDFRFGYGFLIILSLLLVIPLLKKLFTRIKILEGINKATIALIVLGIIIILEIISLPNMSAIIKDRLLLPADYITVNTNKTTLQTLDIYMPIGDDKCFYYAFPCTPYLDKGLDLRGDKLEDGFRIKKD